MSGSAAQRTAIACSFAKPFGSLTPVLPPANAAARQNHRLPNGSFQNMYCFAPPPRPPPLHSLALQQR